MAAPTSAARSVEPAEGPQSLTVGGVTLNYRLDGQGEPLICIHGVGSYLEAWESVAERLSDRFRILTLDLRGHGRSSKVRGRYEIDDFVGDVLALANHIGFATFNLAGFSLGGLIAQCLALTHQQRIRRLVLLATVAGRTEEEREHVAARLAALKAGDRGSHSDASLSRWLTEDFRAKHPEIIERLRRRNAENDPECYAAAYRVLAQTDFGGLLDQIHVPALIATGEQDQGSNPRMARYMHERISGSKLHILPGLRHSILTEAPEQVALLMRGFLVDGTAVEAAEGQASEGWHA